MCLQVFGLALCEVDRGRAKRHLMVAFYWRNSQILGGQASVEHATVARMNARL